MDTDVLHEFTELAKRLNFTETARVLNMSQPTLSKHISSFERELRLELFDRSSGMLRLTRAGTELLPYAYKIIEAQKDFFNEVKELRAAPPPRLRVGGMVEEELVSEALARTLVALNEKYGRNFLEVHPAHHKLPLELLREGVIDIMFDYQADLDEDEELVESVPLGDIPWIALVNKNHRIADKESVSLEELKNETFIKIEGSHISEAWRFVQRGCERHGFTPNIKRHYSMRLTDLITTAASLNDEILVLGENFIKRVGIGTIPFCKQVPISDDDAIFPVAAHYLKNSDNPLIPETVEIIGADSE